MNMQTLANLIGVGGIVWVVYKLSEFGTVVNDAVDGAVLSGKVKVIEMTDGKAELTEGAKNSRDEYVRLGYMSKAYAPFDGCSGDSCYQYTITALGKQYIEKMQNGGT